MLMGTFRPPKDVHRSKLRSQFPRKELLMARSHFVFASKSPDPGSNRHRTEMKRNKWGPTVTNTARATAGPAFHGRGPAQSVTDRDTCRARRGSEGCLVGPARTRVSQRAVSLPPSPGWKIYISPKSLGSESGSVGGNVHSWNSSVAPNRLLIPSSPLHQCPCGSDDRFVAEFPLDSPHPRQMRESSVLPTRRNGNRFGSRQYIRDPDDQLEKAILIEPWQGPQRAIAGAALIGRYRGGIRWCDMRSKRVAEVRDGRPDPYRCAGAGEGSRARPGGPVCSEVWGRLVHVIGGPAATGWERPGYHVETKRFRWPDPARISGMTL